MASFPALQLIVNSLFMGKLWFVMIKSASLYSCYEVRQLPYARLLRNFKGCAFFFGRAVSGPGCGRPP